MAVLAEQAYRFERPADTTTLLQRDYWDPSSGGLLAAVTPDAATTLEAAGWWRVGTVEAGESRLVLA